MSAVYPVTNASVLFEHSRRGDLQGVKTLLRAGGRGAASAAVDPVTGWSALAAALIGGHGSVADALIAAGASVTAVDHRGNTPLHALSAGACADDGDEVGLSVARLMLSITGKAAASAANHEGATPLHLASQRGKCLLIELLVEHGAMLSALDRKGCDPYFFRADTRTERTLLQLLSEHALQGGPLRGSVNVATPWNLTNPGPKQAEASIATNKAVGAAPPRFSRLAVPHLVPAPPAPVPPNAASGSPSKASRNNSNNREPSRTRRLLTAQEERKATYLNKYLAPPDNELPTKVDKKRILSLDEKLRQAFQAADIDGSGTVSKRELVRSMERAGLAAVSTSEGLRLFQAADTDADGQLTYDEFSKLAKQLQPLLAPPAPSAPRAPPAPTDKLAGRTRMQIRKAFDSFDTHRSGWISLAELNGALRACGMYCDDAQLRRMFDEADLDRSGGIDFAEFELLVQRLMAPPRMLGSSDAFIPAPVGGSAVASVFAAFEKGSTGSMSARELPQALRLLGISPEEPPTAQLVQAAGDKAGGVLDRHSFFTLIHHLLRREFDTAAKGPTESEVKTSAAEKKRPLKAPAKPAISSTANVEDIGQSLVRAFLLCPSQEHGTVAMSDVPQILRDAGARPQGRPISSGTARVKFEELLALIAEPHGHSDLMVADTKTSTAIPQPIRLRVSKLTLTPRLVSAQGLSSLCLALHGTLEAQGNRAPLVLRSPMLQKQAEPLQVGLEAVLPVGAGHLQFELLCEAAPDELAPLAANALDLSELYEANLPLLYTLPLSTGGDELVAYLELEAEYIATVPPPLPAISQMQERRVIDHNLLTGQGESSSLPSEAMRNHVARLKATRAFDTIQEEASSWRQWGSEAIDRAASLISGRDNDEINQVLNSSRHELRCLQSGDAIGELNQ